MLVGIVVGGLASIPGAIFGALFIQFVPNVADQISKAAPWAIYGVFLIAFMYADADRHRRCDPPRLGADAASPRTPAQRAGGLIAPPPSRRHIMNQSDTCIAARRRWPSPWPSRPHRRAAQKKYDPGASDTEIKIGQTMPYSGPASAYGTIGKAEAAYFKMINEKGGINGRKINLISLDDGYSPPKTVEQVRKLVEQDEVLLVFQHARHAVQHRRSRST